MKAEVLLAILSFQDIASKEMKNCFCLGFMELLKKGGKKNFPIFLYFVISQFEGIFFQEKKKKGQNRSENSYLR